MAQPQPVRTELRLRVEDEKGTARIAERLARVARRGDMIGLRGGLGSGKTTFARAFIRALTTPEEEVPSPTFTLVQRYETDTHAVFHFDLYRLESSDEVWELGIEEAFAEGVSLVEWPEWLGVFRPAGWCEIDFDLGCAPTARAITIRCGDSWRERLAEASEDLKAYRHDGS
jgi:tRNA threonylcarbamoyladenosine biosynthesis protein TsaE